MTASVCGPWTFAGMRLPDDEDDGDNNFEGEVEVDWAMQELDDGGVSSDDGMMVAHLGFVAAGRCWMRRRTDRYQMR